MDGAITDELPRARSTGAEYSIEKSEDGVAFPRCRPFADKPIPNSRRRSVNADEQGMDLQQVNGDGSILPA
jgi:hypothetical protein